MKKQIVLFLLLGMVAVSCGRKDVVFLSGRVEGGDSLISFRYNEDVVTFPLDKHGMFNGSIPLKKGTYASFYATAPDIYLSPGEDLEIVFNTQNMPASVTFGGTLGGINNYLKEWENTFSFSQDLYQLEERAFIEQAEKLINENTQLLKAKNFDPEFTNLEKDRIQYQIGGHVLLYPVFRKEVAGDTYVPDKAFTTFLRRFFPRNDNLFGSKEYRNFLLNCVYSLEGTDYSKGNTVQKTDYILSNFNRRDMRDFLLAELIQRHIWDNNGLEGAEYALEVLKRECSNPEQLNLIEEQVKLWGKILPGCMTPDFVLVNTKSQRLFMSDFRGSKVYLTIWALWSEPSKKELEHLRELQEEYKHKDITFLALCVGDMDRKEEWAKLVREQKYGGLQAIVDESGFFKKDYMIISVPRFILVDEEGRFITSNAPRPSGNEIRETLNKLLKD